jgi:hypothetical protein
VARPGSGWDHGMRIELPGTVSIELGIDCHGPAGIVHEL